MKGKLALYLVIFASAVVVAVAVLYLARYGPIEQLVNHFVDSGLSEIVSYVAIGAMYAGCFFFWFRAKSHSLVA
jgi:hypothetical protein